MEWIYAMAISLFTPSTQIILDGTAEIDLGPISIVLVDGINVFCITCDKGLFVHLNQAGTLGDVDNYLSSGNRANKRADEKIEFHDNVGFDL